MTTTSLAASTHFSSPTPSLPLKVEAFGIPLAWYPAPTITQTIHVTTIIFDWSTAEIRTGALGRYKGDAGLTLGEIIGISAVVSAACTMVLVLLFISWRKRRRGSTNGTWPDKGKRRGSVTPFTVSRLPTPAPTTEERDISNKGSMSKTISHGLLASASAPPSHQPRYVSSKRQGTTSSFPADSSAYGAAGASLSSTRDGESDGVNFVLPVDVSPAYLDSPPAYEPHDSSREDGEHTPQRQSIASIIHIRPVTQLVEGGGVVES